MTISLFFQSESIIIMFIPYNNGHHTKMECFTSPNMSGNIGNHDQNSQQESQEFFDQLSKNAKNDILWTTDTEYLNAMDTKILSKGRCMHCKNWVGSDHLIQIQHVLNGCKSFKSQGRYIWRHVAVLDYIGTMLEKRKEFGDDIADWAAFRCYLDVPGRRTHDDGTVPDQLLQTSAKPDIFILDQRDHLERYCGFKTR